MKESILPKEDVLYTIIHQEYDAVVKMLGYEYTLEDFKQNNYEKGRDEITTKVINRMLTI